MDLQELLSENPAVDIEIVGIVTEFTRKREKVAVLTLKRPIPLVIGSQSLSETGNVEDAEKLEAYDVEIVRIHQSDFKAKGVSFNKDKTGTIKSDDLLLDVAQSGEVWVKSVSFADFSRGQRQENKNKKIGGTFTKMREAKAKSAFKSGTSSGGNEPVITPTVVGEEETVTVGP